MPRVRGAVKKQPQRVTRVCRGRPPRRPWLASSVAFCDKPGAMSEQPQTLEQKLNQILKDAMRAKDSQTVDSIRMLKTKHMERRTTAGFKGELDDNLWLEVITAYQKQLKKTRDEFVAAGERGKEALPQIDFEIGFCAQFLPSLASEPETRAIVSEVIARLGVTDGKQAGRVMGEIMKSHKGKLDSAIVKQLVAELLP